jgi:prepilin-type N-terminal cleavage/methylation domain-containing protein
MKPKPSVPQRGFTLTELAIATAVLLFGVAAVMQLVPYAMKTNTANRYDTTSVVIAQRYLDELTAQPLTTTTMTDPSCGVMSLGTGVVGASTEYPNGTYLTMFNGSPTVDFTQAAVAGYNCTYIDPNSASSAAYQLRWGVVVTENAGGRVVAKRYVVGVRRNGPQFRFPVNVEATVER